MIEKIAKYEIGGRGPSHLKKFLRKNVKNVDQQKSANSIF